MGAGLTLVTDVDSLIVDTLLGKPEAITKVMLRNAELLSQTAQIKYAPVRTGNLVDSFSVNGLVLESINYTMKNGGTRYDYKGSRFVSDTGVDNSTRYQWYSRAFEELRDEFAAKIKEVM